MSVHIDTKYSVVSNTGEIGEFTLRELFSFSEKTLLYFYPKDDTPGCTIENKDFSSRVGDYKELGITLIGVSKDDTKSHQDFISNQNLAIDLISDPELVLHKELGAYGEKNNYGKIVTGVIRSTFLFNKDGEILQQWKNVRAKGHGAKVLREIHK